MTPDPDPRFLGGEKGMVVTNANDKAFVLAVGWDGAVDMQSNVAKPQMATILRQIADSIDPPAADEPPPPERHSPDTPRGDRRCRVCNEVWPCGTQRMNQERWATGSA